MPEGEAIERNETLDLAAEWHRVGLERPHFCTRFRGQSDSWVAPAHTFTEKRAAARRAVPVLLGIQKSYELLANHGCFAREICDTCGAVLAAVRFMRKGEAGEWCSREGRDGKEAHAPGTCRGCHAKLPDGKRRGASYCDDACRKAHERASDTKLSRTKPSTHAGFHSIPGPGSYLHSRNPQSGLIAAARAKGVLG